MGLVVPAGHMWITGIHPRILHDSFQPHGPCCACGSYVDHRYSPAYSARQFSTSWALLCLRVICGSQVFTRVFCTTVFNLMGLVVPAGHMWITGIHPRILH